MKILCIAHGGPACGMGHVVRSAALASALRGLGCEVWFYSQYPEGAAYIRRHGFALCGAPLAGSASVQPDCIIADTYDVSYAYLLSLKNNAFTVYIDDLAAFAYPVDILLNGNITGGLMGYPQDGPLLLTGIAYNLLREEFQNLPRRHTKEKPETICITTGASDPDNAVGRILHAVTQDAQLRQYAYSVIIGPAFRRQTEILQIAAACPNIRCFVQPESISGILLEADAAICAGGGTVYELACCGVPMLSFIYAENQRTVVEYMASQNLLTTLGGYGSFTDTQLTHALKQILNDSAYRKTQAEKLQAMADGQGARRAAEQILRFCRQGRRQAGTH